MYSLSSIFPDFILLHCATHLIPADNEFDINEYMLQINSGTCRNTLYDSHFGQLLDKTPLPLTEVHIPIFYNRLSLFDVLTFSFNLENVKSFPFAALPSVRVVIL